MRFFNTVGPCVESWHYMLPAAERLPDVPRLIERGMSFVVHAPCQTGKTTTLMAVARQLTESGKYAALCFSCEAGKIAGDDHVAGQRAVLSAIRQLLTAGQPWLANALANEIVEEMGIAPPEPITAEHVEQAKERLILARATHLDSLVARLGEDRVRRIIEPLLAGGTLSSVTYDDDAAYVHDLGLIALEPEVHIANPIYREVIVRVLAARVEGDMRVTPRHFLAPDGRLDVPAILRSFAAFWREHGAVLTGALTYHEVAPQLVLMAYLQSAVNGTGFIDREYGVGRGRIDLQLRWPYLDERGQRQWQREAIELKVWRDKKPDPLGEGLRQLDEYLGQLGLDQGVLVIFDRRARPAGVTDDEASPPIVFEQARTASGGDVTVLRA